MFRKSKNKSISNSPIMYIIIPFTIFFTKITVKLKYKNTVSEMNFCKKNLDLIDYMKIALTHK